MSFESTTANVIKLTLLHPSRPIPVRSWTFEHEPIIRIGRSIRNHVVLYSAVVSRCHVELQLINRSWKVINLGTNGTYINGIPIVEAPVQDGQVIHLAVSGPKIQLSLDTGSSMPHQGSAGHSIVKQQVQVLEHPNVQTQVQILTSPSPTEISLPTSQEEVTKVDRPYQR